jgi:tRNA A37 methylthiotransferase MiaB
MFSMVYDTSSPQLTPLQKKLADERVIEKQMNYLKNVGRVNEAELQRTMISIERQVLVVSRADAAGDRALAKQELRKLMLIDGGHANSPLYRFCVSKIKEYE